MVKFYVYILYSQNADKYYVGSTRIDPAIRLERHLEEYYGKLKFTKSANDWRLFFTIDCQSYSQALKIEKHIKQMKSRTYLNNLTKYPEISLKLLEKFNKDC